MLPCVTEAKTTLQSSGIHTSSGSGVQPVPSSTPNDVLPTTTTPAVMDSNKLSGAQLPLSGVQTPVKLSLNSFAGVQLLSTCIQPTLSGTVTLCTSTLSGVQSSIPGVQNVVSNVPNVSASPNLNSELPSNDKLPDLVRHKQNDSDNYSILLDTVPPIGELPPDNIFDGGTTEEELDAVDALLSLGTVRDTATENLPEENSALMPIDGNSKYQDVNLVTVHLDQVSVDGAIAQIVEEESISESVDNEALDRQLITGNLVCIQINNSTNEGEINVSAADGTTVSGIQDSISGVHTALFGVQNTKKDLKHDETNVKDADTDSTNTGMKTKGYVKVTTHGIRKNVGNENRSYHCSICGVRKCSAHNLNIHHRKRHAAQMCGVCGKMFELASSLSHHMYTHDERRFFCETCSFHCHFESELKKHNITHHSQPSHQCMRKNCGRWFKRKSDLVLHIETHKNGDLLECETCDFKTTIAIMTELL